MGKDVIILGIHDGHNCGASLSVNGGIVASISEERLTRNKNEVGFPAGSIQAVLRIAGVSAPELSEVAFASEFMHWPNYLRDLDPWYRVGREEQEMAKIKPKEHRRLVFEQRRKERIEAAKELLGVSEDKIGFIEHHAAHLASAYYTAPKYAPGKKFLGITCDGSGDGISSTVSVCSGNKLERIADTSRHASLGKIYSRVTMLMGMKPWEHEYKIMGLAPYADPERSDKAAGIFRNLLRARADGLGFEQVGELSMNYIYYHLRDAFEGVRFDVIAGATQLFTEEMLLKLVKGCVRNTGISDIVLAGGVFMNVKANMLIAALEEVASVHIMPSCADESLSIGACLHRYYDLTGDPDHSQSVFNDLYLGDAYAPEDESRAVEKLLAGQNVEVTTPEDVDLAAAGLLAQGKVVARCRGRMEWGARSLGNRSILARADDYRVVARINDMIKMRDFWMPFAPSMTEERAHLYFDDPKDLRPYFMINAFPSKPGTYEHLIAGSHPKDKTIRPQVVTREANPGYHKLINAFEDKTGMGVILNTSFNLHGYPIVRTPEDAVRVFLSSGLEYLALEKHLIGKKETSCS